MPAEPLSRAEADALVAVISRPSPTGRRNRAPGRWSSSALCIAHAPTRLVKRDGFEDTNSARGLTLRG
jgi:hypothetical protein